MTGKEPQWSQIRERGGALPLQLVLALYRLGGRLLCQVCLYLVIAWYWLLAAAARRHSLAYLRRLHDSNVSASPFSERPGWRHSFRHFMRFGEAILDKMEAWLGKVPEQALQLHGHEQLRACYQRGAILLVSHFGNIEFLRALKSEHVQRINVLVYQRHADQFNRFLKKINPRADVHLISVDQLGVETALLLQAKLDVGEWIIIAADRVPLQSARVEYLPFFGQLAGWPQGAWVLASLLKVPVLAVFCYRHQRNFEVHIHRVAEQLRLPRHQRSQSLREYMQRYIALVEYHCRRAPYQWFNFYSFWETDK